MSPLCIKWCTHHNIMTPIVCIANLFETHFTSQHISQAVFTLMAHCTPILASKISDIMPVEYIISHYPFPWMSTVLLIGIITHYPLYNLSRFLLKQTAFVVLNIIMWCSFFNKNQSNDDQQSKRPLQWCSPDVMIYNATHLFHCSLRKTPPLSPTILSKKWHK